MRRLSGLLALPVLLVGALASAHPAAAEALDAQLAPLFEARDLEGRTQSLGNLLNDGKTTILLFWAVRCAPCLREMDVMEKLYKQHGPAGLAVLGIEASGSGPERVAEIVDQLKNIPIVATYPIIPDQSLTLSKKFGVTTTPRTFLVDRHGQVVTSCEGFSGEQKQQLIAAVETALAGRPVASPQTASITVAGQQDNGAVAAAETTAEHAGETQTGGVREEFERNRYFADFYFHKEEFERAILCYQRAIELDPSDVHVRLKLGEVFARLKRYAEAREAWEGVLRLNPDNKEADLNMRRMVRGGL